MIQSTFFVKAVFIVFFHPNNFDIMHRLFFKILSQYTDSLIDLEFDSYSYFDFPEMLTSAIMLSLKRNALLPGVLKDTPLIQ